MRCESNGGREVRASHLDLDRTIAWNCAGLAIGMTLHSSALVVWKHGARTKLDLQWQVMRTRILINREFHAFWLFGVLPAPGEFPDCACAGLAPFPCPAEGVAGAFVGRGCESAVYG